jgi:hypothetical protein
MTTTTRPTCDAAHRRTEVEISTEVFSAGIRSAVLYDDANPLNADTEARMRSLRSALLPLVALLCAEWAA